MRTEPDLDQSRLRALLLDRYRLDAARLTFVPFGTDSWSYVAASRDGRRVFVKLARRDKQDRSASETSLMAALATRHVPVPRPMADVDGGFVNAVDGYGIQVLEYLDGRTLEDETAWPDDLYAQVAETVAAVHASTNEVRHLVDRIERFELPFLAPFKETLAVIEAGGALPADVDPTVAAVRKMLLPRARDLRVAMARLEALCDLASDVESDEVLCHTDVWGSNLLLSDDGILHLIDWNDALIGPPEADLFMFAGTSFFPADRFGWFLERYQAAFRPTRPDVGVLGFYLYRRSLEDLALFLADIVDGRLDALGAEETLRVIASVLTELPRLEGRISQIADVLGHAPGD